MGLLEIGIVATGRDVASHQISSEVPSRQKLIR